MKTVAEREGPHCNCRGSNQVEFCNRNEVAAPMSVASLISPAVVAGRSVEQWARLCAQGQKECEAHLPAWVRMQSYNFGLWVRCVLDAPFELTEPHSWYGPFLTLVERLTGQTISGKDVVPKLHFQKVEKCAQGLNVLKDSGIKLVGIGPEDLLDAKLRLCLGLMWTVILRYEIVASLPKSESISPKADLLQHVQNVGGIRVNNFSKDWLDGRMFASFMQATLFKTQPFIQALPAFARLHSSWMELQSLSHPALPREIWSKIFSLALLPCEVYELYVAAACESFGIPPFLLLLDESFDELSLMNYVAMVVRVFKSKEQ